MLEKKQFPGTFESLAAIGDWINQLAIDAGFDKFTTYDITLAVDEVCSNIIEHGYKDTIGGRIAISAKRSPGRLELIIEDSGTAFDITEQPKVTLPRKLKQRENGGMGIFLVQQYIDEMFYERYEGVNRLTLIKVQREDV